MNNIYEAILMGRPFAPSMPRNPYLGVLGGLLTQVDQFKQQYPRVDARGSSPATGMHRGAGAPLPSGTADYQRPASPTTSVTGSVV